MRITTKMMGDNAAARLQMNYDRLFDLQEKVASGKKYSQPSDQPSGASRALQLRSTLQANQAYLDTANRVDLWLSTVETSLRGLVDVAGRTINMANSATSDTMGPDERSGILSEIKGLFMQAVNLANTTHEGKYIFNGYNVDETPYEVDQTAYQLIKTPSDTGQTIVQKYGKSQSIIVNVNGETVVTPFLEGLRAVIDALEAPTFDRADLLDGISQVSSSLETIKESLTTIGARQREMKTSITFLEKNNVEIKSLLSQNEDVNLADAISALKQQETAYQTSLNVASSVINHPNLFNYLR